jgi:hypothetical protein
VTQPASPREFAEMYVAVMAWVRQSDDESERASLLQTAEYFYDLSVAAAQREPGVNAGPLKQLSFGAMHALADMFEGWALDRRTREPLECLGLADVMRELADIAGPSWVPVCSPGANDASDRETLLAFLARYDAPLNKRHGSSPVFPGSRGQEQRRSCAARPLATCAHAQAFRESRCVRSPRAPGPLAGGARAGVPSRSGDRGGGSFRQRHAPLLQG